MMAWSFLGWTRNRLPRLLDPVCRDTNLANAIRHAITIRPDADEWTTAILHPDRELLEDDTTDSTDELYQTIEVTQGHRSSWTQA